MVALNLQSLEAAMHQAMSNLSVALDLAQAGVYVFPCQAEGKEAKKPCPGVMWRSAATTDVRRVAEWWEQYPDALVGINCEPSDFLVIDADYARGIRQWHEEVLQGRPDAAPVVRTPGGGEHRYFRRGAHRLGNGRGALPAKVEDGGIDVRGAGGYVIAPGSVLPDGRRYDPGDHDILAAPPIPDWLVEILKGSRARDEAPIARPGGIAARAAAAAGAGRPMAAALDGREGRVAAYGRAALDAEIARVRDCGKGGRNEALNAAAFSLGTLIGAGALSRADVEGHLLVAAQACGLLAEDGRRSCEATIRSGLEAGLRQPREIPDSGEYDALAEIGAGIAAGAMAKARGRAIVRTDAGEIADAETGQVLKSEAKGPGDVLDALPYGRGLDWSHPGGLLEDMVQFILRSSRRPNRPLAVAAATAALSAACGRHLYGPTGTSLNLYMVMLANSTVGKGRPLSAVSEILRAAGLGILLTSGKSFSVSAIEQMITEKPACVATVDEIGANLLGRMSNRNSNNHELAMRGALLELWSREMGMAPFATTHRATAGSVEVPSPSLTLFGASTPEAFYGAVTLGSVRDGFLNRFLLAASAPRARAQDVAEQERIVPSSVCTRLQRLLPSAGGNLTQSVGVFMLSVDPDGQRVAWAPGVGAYAAEMEEAILDIMDANPEQAPLMGRVFEYAVRLATLHALSRDGRTAEVERADMEWGAAWAISSARSMLNAAGAMMAANEYETRFNAVRNAIERAGTMTRQDLLRQVRSVSARERDDIVKHLIEGGWIEAFNEKTGGREAHGWRWVG